MNKSFVLAVAVLGLLALATGTTLTISNFAAFNSPSYLNTGSGWGLLGFIVNSSTVQEYSISQVFMPNRDAVKINMQAYVRAHDPATGQPSGLVLGSLATGSATTYPASATLYASAPFLLQNGTQYWMSFRAGCCLNFTYTDLANQGDGRILFNNGWSATETDFNIIGNQMVIAQMTMQSCNLGCSPGLCGHVPDGCGRSFICGCAAGQTCNAGSCCTPSSCGSRCGVVSDGCGGSLGCSCPAGQTCNAGSCCTPSACGSRCGVVSDGCGGSLSCSCPAGRVCTGGSCCTPSACGSRCGVVSDGCGRSLSCSCPAGQVCTGGSCCTPSPCGSRCGVVSDGCGGTLTCPACCVPRTSCGNVCGSISDGCGGTLFCGCPSGKRCCDGRCWASCP